ncbi:MAG: LytTR family DNA-binding domain-containing protein [Sulfurimicrobium sp.]|nr:LytTR family DNA-binding domain-containing protein [Sulfurimicrobium sp.]MDP1704953.1 LytTR family DNA-binding domain-containing protein [Sulfurimicrobium sp.]MDP2200303.1 LytTR family DNA-binding domain-containing protein [Sulfurimicrobium sp.]MDP3688339.1 LytTR family DNA-binding domain-containing protein [Sulfurimicrobium sp.]
MKAIIADDERHLADDMQRRLLRLWPELQIVTVVHDGVATAAALVEIKPDFAFLDIRMPGQSGLDAALAAPTGCRVVFVTAYDDHAVQAFEQAAVDYLLKPVSDERLARCVERLKRHGAAAPGELLERLQRLLAAPAAPEPLRWLRAQAGQVVRMVAVEDACYFQSADKYTLLLTRDAELLLRTPLKELLAQLDPQQFWQVHRGTVVNVRQIVSAHHDLLGKATLTLRDRPEKIAVSRSYAHLFRQM